MTGRGEEPAARRIVVSGRVQGVGFRFSAQHVAKDLRIAGWARNLPDGRVEVHLQGEPGAMRAMVDWLRRGPVGAAVTLVEEVPAAVEPGLGGFVVRR
ncbi:MAG TPA: acylphosphatase [Acidimicrobiia bacterium]|nr:acylphosphatase [Acidimicrobiia bacterium]